MAHALSAVAELAVKYVNTTQRNIFLTGKAGTGKTTLLKYIIDNTFKNAVVAAPTGIAAINAGGVTLHSLLQLPFGTFVPENITFEHHDIQDKVNTPYSVISQLQMNASKRALIREIELLIIDEVSMLRADLLDCIDHILKHVRKNGQSFGGVQVLFIGDLNQLPPVVRNSEWPLLSKFYKCPFFFDSQVLKKAPPVYIELDKIYRQSDQSFLAILNRLRDNEMIDDDLKILNSHFKENFSPEPDAGFIYITTHNKKSEEINKKELAKINSTTFDYKAKISGDFPEHMYPLPQTLSFKKGCQVMFIKNDPSGEGQFYNGKIGHIESLGPEHIEVRLNDPESLVNVEVFRWENKKYNLNKDNNVIEETITGSFEQYPLKLAWAITVHKSQGLTFENAILDLTDAFAPGQMYVALSRLTSMQGLVLSTPIPTSNFKKDVALSDFNKNKKELDSLNRELLADRKLFLFSYTAKAFDFSGLILEFKKSLGSSKEEERSIKFKHSGLIEDLLQETNSHQEVASRFVRQVRKITNTESEYLSLLYERVTKAQAFFFPFIASCTEKIKTHTTTKSDQPKAKKYAKELKGLSKLFAKQKIDIEKLKLFIAHAAANKTLTRADLLNSSAYRELEQGHKTSAKTNKIPTREITFELYKEGNNIEEIAEKRGLTATTIEGHLSTYVLNGDLEATALMDEKKINQILTVAKTFETSAYGAIKAKLGDEFSYGDIKIAMAHLQAVENNEP